MIFYTPGHFECPNLETTYIYTYTYIYICVFVQIHGVSVPLKTHCSNFKNRILWGIVLGKPQSINQQETWDTFRCFDRSLTWLWNIRGTGSSWGTWLRFDAFQTSTEIELEVSWWRQEFDMDDVWRFLKKSRQEGSEQRCRGIWAAQLWKIERNGSLVGGSTILTLLQIQTERPYLKMGGIPVYRTPYTQKKIRW